MRLSALRRIVGGGPAARHEALEKVRKKHKGETVGLIVPEPLASMVRAMLIGPCGEGHRQTSACGSWQVLDTDAPKVAAAG